MLLDLATWITVWKVFLVPLAAVTVTTTWLEPVRRAEPPTTATKASASAGVATTGTETVPNGTFTA